MKKSKTEVINEILRLCKILTQYKTDSNDRDIIVQSINCELNTLGKIESDKLKEFDEKTAIRNKKKYMSGYMK